VRLYDDLRVTDTHDVGMSRQQVASGVKAGENGFAMTLGGGVDLRFRSRFAIRLIQAEYLLTRFPSVTGASATQNNLRLSTGVIFRFGSR